MKKYYVFAATEGKWIRTDNGDGTHTSHFEGDVREFINFVEADNYARTAPNLELTTADPRTPLRLPRIKTELPVWMARV